MSKNRTRTRVDSNIPSSPQIKNTVAPTAVTPKTQTRDFGVLKVRSMKIKESEAVVLKDNRRAQNFAKLDNERIIRIVQGTDLEQIRELSKWYAQTNGMYARAVRYLADIYRFDFMIYPNLDLDMELNEKANDKILKRFNLILEHFDNSSIQIMCRKWANQVALEGVYYGYICEDINDKLVIQDLPTNFCRSRFLHRGLPVIEFNARYFDKVTDDAKYREQILLLFPKEFQDGYRKFKNDKLPAETQSDDAGWFILDTNRAFKFNFYDNDMPPFLYAIPALISLSEVQDLEKEKLIQEIQKILVQKFALDKNGQIPFTMPELQRLNQNAIDMVGDAVGVSVLSTIADVSLENLANDGKAALNQVDAAENSVYNDLGISTNLFNTDGNLALEKSVTVDEAYTKQLLLQFERFFNNYIGWKFNKQGSKFRLKMLNTTIFNYMDLSAKYESLTKIGFSRFMPIVSLGHTQKELTSLVRLEQQIMVLDNFMLPPFSSNTMSSDTWRDIKELQGSIAGTPSTPATSPLGSSQNGRPALPGDQKSDKTIANQASL